MFRQEGMDFQTRIITQQTPYLFLIEFPGLVPCQGKAFQHMAADIRLLRLQTRCDIIREVDGDFHRDTLTSCITCEALASRESTSKAHNGQPVY
jgi:hypothetical protein